MKTYLLCFFVLIPVLLRGQIITTVVGTGISGSTGDGGPASAARIGATGYMTFDSLGNFYFSASNKIRKVSPSGIITTFAGTGSAGFGGDGSAATAATLNFPSGIAIDLHNNLFISDQTNCRIRKVDVTTRIINTVVGTGTIGYTGDGGIATAANIGHPYDITFDGDGNLYFIDATYSIIRKVDTFGIITTIGGVAGAGGYSGDGGPATAANIVAEGLFVDFNSNSLYIGSGMAVRKINLHSGIISTVAGQGHYSGHSGDGGPATDATFRLAWKAILDRRGNLYISEQDNNDVRIVDTSGIIQTFAGNGTGAGTGGGTYSGDGGPATAAGLTYARGIALDNCDNLFILDAGNYRIRKVTMPVTLNTDTPTVLISSDRTDTVCAGTTVTYTATFTHGGHFAAYQWFVNATAISGATDSFYSYTPANGDSVKCTLTTWNACSNPAYDTSNVKHMLVNAVVTPTIAISPAPNDTVCAGTSVTYSASVTGGGASPAYQWKMNGANVGTAATYSFTPSNGDSVRCVLTSNATCPSPATVSSNMVRMVVNSFVTPTVTISASSSDTVCAGTPVTYSATATGGGSTPAYRWVVNGATAGTGSSYTYTPSNGDSIRCVLTTSYPCPTSTTASSNTVYMVVNPLVVPTIVISATPNDTLCNANYVNFTATGTGGGSAPVYHWYLNNAPVGSGGTSYAYAPVNGDSVHCMLISNAQCASPNTVNSNTVHLVVAAVTHPVVTLSGPVVAPIGNPVTITATVAGAGSSYTIHWFNLGTEFTATTVPSVTYTKTLAQDSISAKIVSHDFCYDSTVAAGVVVWDHDLSSYQPSAISFQLYPNPVRDELVISSGISIEQVAITNLLGQVVLQSAAISSQLSVIDVGQLPAGVYFVKVACPAITGGKVGVGRFVKE